ncbi:GPI mannosyltransferase 3-like [Ornithodoros turicata]|uniref:GPI mannosyltransferase 3-like n=1 Tax=Ornithodoros turicata TaxID=34597 RepID=UPI003138D4B2
MEGYPSKFYVYMFMLFRIGGGFFVTTFFVPDEYWQSLEVAHDFVFGYGYRTWEWKYGIRSALYPLFVAGQYKLLKLLNLDTVYMVTTVPKLVQAAMSALGDYWTVMLARLLFGDTGAGWTAFSLLCSWFLHYTASRTLTNVAEQSITAAALYFYPWGGQKQPSTSWAYMWLVGLACMIRPTAAIMWLPFLLLHLVRGVHSKGFLLRRLIFTSVVCFVLQLLIDRWFYGYFLVTPWNFIKMNLFRNIGAHYGTNPWHWYFSMGLPAVLGLQMVPFFLGIRANRCRLLVGVVFWHMFTLSLVSHKEFRFLLPIMPLAMCVCGAGMARLPKVYSMTLAALLAVGFFPPALYLGSVHQRGQVEVMNHIANLTARDKDASVFFIMPCHSTPYFSHVHRRIKMLFVTCEPNLQGVKDYKDESERFFKDPERGVKGLMSWGYPKYIVFYDTFYKHMLSFVADSDYQYKLSFFNTHIPTKGVGKEVWFYQIMGT